MDKVLVMNVCDGVECKFWRHITIELGLARWLIGEGSYNGQGAGDGSSANVCDGVECQFWRHISIELGLARWLI